MARARPGVTVGYTPPVQAAWAYAQMVRWGQAALSRGLLAAATDVFRPGLCEVAVGSPELPPVGEPADNARAFAGPAFDPHDTGANLAAWLRRRA